MTATLATCGTLKGVRADQLKPGDHVANFIHRQSALVEHAMVRRELGYDLIEITLWVQPLGLGPQVMIGVTTEPEFVFQVVRELGQ